MTIIRPEQSGDIDAVRLLNEIAFGQNTEAEIVDSIRQSCNDLISLVAVEGDRIVGHILFSPATAGKKNVVGMGLAPMAILPERQGQGIGSRLVRTGIGTLIERGCPFIVVLGHPDYYPRFGFVPASHYGLSCQWEGVPDEAFMVLILDDIVVATTSGVVRYRDEFDAAM